ncbi:MAG: hypothetical protein ACKO2G_07490 [Verrucomicrobiales bacterium]
MNPPPTVERDFMEARARMIDLAAYLDRVHRYGDGDDFRHQALLACLPLLTDPNAEGNRARSILLALSDPSVQPIPAATIQGAFGAPRPLA